MIKRFLGSTKSRQAPRERMVNLTSHLRLGLRQIKSTGRELVRIGDVALHKTHGKQADQTGHQVTGSGKFLGKMRGPLERRLQLCRRVAVDRIQRRGQLQQHVELLFVARTPSRLLRDEL